MGHPNATTLLTSGTKGLLGETKTPGARLVPA